MRALLIIGMATLVLGGCYSTRSTSISTGSAESILKQDGFTTKSVSGGTETDFAWQKPNNPPSALCFGLIFTRHRVVNGQVTSETYGWSLNSRPVRDFAWLPGQHPDSA